MSLHMDKYSRFLGFNAAAQNLCFKIAAADVYQERAPHYYGLAPAYDLFFPDDVPVIHLTAYGEQYTWQSYGDVVPAPLTVGAIIFHRYNSGDADGVETPAPLSSLRDVTPVAIAQINAIDENSGGTVARITMQLHAFEFKNRPYFLNNCERWNALSPKNYDAFGGSGILEPLDWLPSIGDVSSGRGAVKVSGLFVNGEAVSAIPSELAGYHGDDAAQVGADGVLLVDGAYFDYRLAVRPGTTGESIFDDLRDAYRASRYPSYSGVDVYPWVNMEFYPDAIPALGTSFQHLNGKPIGTFNLNGLIESAANDFDFEWQDWQAPNPFSLNARGTAHISHIHPRALSVFYTRINFHTQAVESVE